MPGYKTNKRKRTSSKTPKKTAKRKTVQTIARRTLLSLMETKKVGYGWNNISGFATSGAKSWNLMYEMSLGSTGSGPNQRVGDSIYIQNIRITGVINRTGQVTTTGHGPIFARVALIATDEFQTLSNITNPIRTDQGSITQASSYAGGQLGAFDTDRCNVLHDQIVTLQPSPVATAQSNQANYFVINKSLNKKVTFQGPSTSAIKGMNYYLYIAVMWPGFVTTTIQTQDVNAAGNFYMTFKDS